MKTFRCSTWPDSDWELETAEDAGTAAIQYARAFNNHDRRRVHVTGPGTNAVFDVSLEWRADLVVP